jgi:hypothetical protein
MRSHGGRYVSVLCMGCVGMLMCARVQAVPMTSVAILADHAAGDEVAPLLSLLEARLSQDEQIQLLERTRIERMLAEQQLSTAGLTQRDSVIKAGRLLRVQAFVLLSLESATSAARPVTAAGQDNKLVQYPVPELPALQGELREPDTARAGSHAPTGRLVRVRVAETAHGLRLWESYESLEASNVEAVAGRIAERVRTAVGKIAQLDGQMVPVGIVDIHRVQLPEKYEYLARVLPGLLSARLSKEPRILMLERESLGTLLREKQLTEGPEAAFWNSAILIDGYLRPEDRGGVEVDLRLQQADNQELPAVRMSLDPNSPAASIAAAAARIVEVVSDSTPAGRWNPAEEAAEFYQQGQLLAAHERRESATIQFESAHALEPENVDYTAALFANELPTRQYISDSTGPAEGFGTYSDLQMAELTSVLVRQIRDQYHAGRLTAPYIWHHYARSLGSGLPLGYFSSHLSVTTEQVRLINRENRRIWVEMMEEASAQGSIYPAQPQLNALARIRLTGVSSDEPGPLLAHVRKVLNEAILPPEMGGRFPSPDDRCFFCEQGLYYFIIAGLLSGSHVQDSQEQVLSLWSRYVEELSTCGDPLVEFYACLVQAEQRLGRDSHPRDPQAALASCRKMVDILLNDLHSPHEPVSDAQKERLRKRVVNTLARVREADVNILWERICQPLVQARDARNLAIWYSFSKASSFLGETSERSSSLLAQTIDILETKRDDPQVVKTLALLQAQLKRFGPPMVRTDKKAGTGPGRIRATMLLRREDWPGAAYDRQFYNPREGTSLVTIMQDGTLWVGFGMGGANAPPPRSLGLAGFDLPRRQLQALWKVEFNVRGTIGISGLTVSGKQSYAAVPWIGIVELPGSAAAGRELIRAPRILTDRNGLPSLAITGMASAGERLWVAYGTGLYRGDEAGLGLYDPVAGSWESILCSTARGATPFNAGRSYELFALTPAPPDKLFFFVSGTYQRETETTTDGLWRMNVRTKELTYFGVGGIGRPDWGHVLADRKPWVFCDSFSLAEFDPESERGRLLLGEPWEIKMSWSLAGKRLEFARADLASEESQKGLSYGPWITNCVDLSGAALHAHRVWARLGPSQLVVIPCHGAQGHTMITDNNWLDGTAVERFVSTPYGLIAIGNGTVGLVETTDIQSIEPR